MSAPIFDYATADGATLIGALVIGIAFGFFLERGGMGNARKLAGQFYLTDLTVFKLMFSAIVTAGFGVFFLARFGVLDMARVAVPPTYIVPQIAGGLIFGAGFVLAGLCPGTSCVAAATGRYDGMAVIAGMFAGVFAFDRATPLVGRFYESTPRGPLTLDGFSGFERSTLIFVITMVALLGFAAAEAIERRSSRVPA